MTSSQPARPTIHRAGFGTIRLAGLLAGVAAIAVALSSLLPGSPPSTHAAPNVVVRDEPLGKADGAVPERTSAFDDGVPGVANLDPALLGALRRAAAAAADDGVALFVDSGWRSPAYQARLLEEAVSKYGSAAEAARWVATPDRSAHVSGDAVDVGPSRAAAWLAEHGAPLGLCPVYGNEPWHYELSPRARRQGCPAEYADPTHDPRMQR